MSEESIDGNEDRNHITGLEHALRVATLAYRHDPFSEMVFVGLVHDLARPLSDPFHGEVMAEIVRDMVSDVSYNVLRTHGLYQEAHIHGTELDTTTAWHTDGLTLCAWEIASFRKPWNFPFTTMSVDDAISIINDVCKGRD